MIYQIRMSAKASSIIFIRIYNIMIYIIARVVTNPYLLFGGVDFCDSGCFVLCIFLKQRKTDSSYYFIRAGVLIS